MKVESGPSLPKDWKQEETACLELPKPTLASGQDVASFLFNPYTVYFLWRDSAGIIFDWVCFLN